MFSKAQSLYSTFGGFRQRRRRLMRYVYGNQWGDRHSPGFTEGDALYNDGKYPVIVNLLNRTVRMLVGRFRKQAAELYATLDEPTVADNNLAELDARLFEEFVISGCAVQRIGVHNGAGGRQRVVVDNISPHNFFVSQFYDPRGTDIEIIGTVERLTLTQFLAKFATSAHQAERLRGVFAACLDSCDSFAAELADTDTLPRIDVVEVWSLEPTGNARNPGLRWHQRHYTASGSLLQSTTLPEGRSHPFAVKFHPLIDGHVYSYIDTLIDRQRSINRLLTSFEASVAASAKGTLLLPLEQVPRGINVDEVAALWARPDSVIPITGKGGYLPQQLITNTAATGIVPLIDMQLKLFDETSGITDALKGTNTSAGLSVEARRELTDTAATATADLLDTYLAYLSARPLPRK